MSTTNILMTSGVHPDSPHYGHVIQYGEYGWQWYDVRSVRADGEEATVSYDRVAVDGEINDTVVVCATCDGRQISVSELLPDTDVWYGEYAPDTDN